MDIKEIALRVGLQAFEEHPYDEGHVVSPSGYTWIDDKLIEFAESLISAYKAELLKEVGEPVGSVSLVNCTDIWLNGQLYEANPKQYLGAAYFKPVNHGDKLFTSDQIAAAIAKATKPLEDQLAAAQEEIAFQKSAHEQAQQLLLEQGDQLAKAEQRYLAWEGGEEWEQLAFQLCADECGEESCNELIWEGCQPEPWGDRWLKYESEAKRIIQLVRQYAPDKKAEQRVAEACALTYLEDYDLTDIADRVRDGEWRKFVKEV